MNAKTKRRVGTKIVNLILICSLLLSSCAYLPLDVQQTWDSIWQQTVGVAINYVKQLVQGQVDKAKQEVTSTIDDIISSIIDKPLEYFGWGAPDEVGIVSIGINPQTARPEIEAAFKAAYKRAGGGRVIGWPDDLVKYWSDSHHELLIQYFSLGDEGRSAIVMENGGDKAFYMLGKFLDTYTNLGGPGEAGFPVTDSKVENVYPIVYFWIPWGRGRVQEFNNGEVFGLTQRRGGDSVRIVPPFLYKKTDIKILGYPLSSYPLEERDWRSDDSIDADLEEILTNWENQPFRIMAFEHGSIYFSKEKTDVQVVKSQSLYRLLNSRKAVFVGNVGAILVKEYDRLNYSGPTDYCFMQSIAHAGYGAQSKGIKEFLRVLKFSVINSALDGVSIFVTPLYGKLIMIAAEFIVDIVEGDDLFEAFFIRAIGGFMMDVAYSQAIGEILSNPAADITVEGVAADYNNLLIDRLYYNFSVDPGEVRGVGQFVATMPVRVVFSYDQGTNMVTGYIHNKDCGPRGQEFYGFYFRYLDHIISEEGEVAPLSGAWDGKIHFINLYTGEEIHY